MKQNFPILIALFSCLIFVYIISILEFQTVKKEIIEPRPYPGWFSQWFEMKKNEHGEIPKGVYSRIIQQLKSSRSGISNLYNITEIGPANVGGRTRSILIDQSDHDHFFAGSVSGGLWESSDKGLTWNAINDYATNLSVTSIAQDYFNNEIIYYSTGEVTGNTQGVGGAGVFKSTNGGQSFSQLATASDFRFEYTWSVKTSPVSPNMVYIGTADYGLFRSTDAGNNLQRVFVNSTRDISDIEIFPDGGVMIGVMDQGIYYSPSGDSSTFVKLLNDIPQVSFDRIEIAYCKNYPDIVYAVYENENGTGVKSFWRTDDRGQNWVEKSNPDTDSISFVYPWYCFALAVHPNSPTTVVVAGVDAAITDDSGFSWQEMIDGHVDYHTIVFDEDDPSTFYSGCDGGIYKYNISNATSVFEDRKLSYNVTQFYQGAYFPSGIEAMGGTQDNGTQATRNADLNFDHISGGDGGFAQVNQQFPNISYVSYQYGELRRAFDSYSDFPDYHHCLFEMDADNDFLVDDPVWFINPYEINMFTGSQLYYVTLNRIWRTIYDASEWEPLTDMNSLNGGDYYSIGISRESNPTVYLGGAAMLFGRVDDARTSSAGDEIDLRQSVPDSILSSFISNITVHPSDNSVLYLSLSNFSSLPRVWKVTNAKTNNPQWMDISGDLPDELPVNWIEVDPQNPDSYFIAATDFGLYTTTNGGINWNKEESIPNVAIHNIRLRHSDGKLFIFTHGRGLFVADIYPNQVFVDENETHELHVFPNPFHDLLTIENISTETQIEIFDLSGKKVFDQSVSGSRNIDLRNLSSGNYFLRTTNASGIAIQKLVKF